MLYLLQLRPVSKKRLQKISRKIKKNFKMSDRTSDLCTKLIQLDSDRLESPIPISKKETGKFILKLFKNVFNKKKKKIFLRSTY